MAVIGSVSAAASAGVAAAPRWRVAYSSATVMSGLTDIVALSASDVWAVGDVQPTSGPHRAFVRRWNGRSWIAVRLPRPYRGADLSVVAGSSARNVWVFGGYDVGSHRRQFALRWNGSWSLRGAWVSDNGVGAAAVISPRDVWVFGTIGTWHLNGTKWTLASVQFSIFGVSVLSGNDIWGIGNSPISGPELARYHGGKWTFKALPHIASSYPGPVATDVVALSDRNIWVVGGTVTSTGSMRPCALHWSAGTWHRPRFPLAYGSWLMSVVPDGSGGLWAAYQGPYGGSVMARFTGGRWRDVTVPHVAGKNTAVFVLSRVPGSGTVFSAGSSFWGHYPDTSALVLKYSR